MVCVLLKSVFAVDLPDSDIQAPLDFRLDKGVGKTNSRSEVYLVHRHTVPPWVGPAASKKFTANISFPTWPPTQNQPSIG
jgi:hypothetical protein